MQGGALILEDGRAFRGRLAGAAAQTLPAGNSDPGVGEVVFQTGMTGYQEVITDPSYRGQIVAFTAPHLGNTGTNAADAEAPAPALAGVVCRSLAETPSSWRNEEALPAYLERWNIPCLTEVDTRALTRHLRTAGALRGVIVPESVAPDVAAARARAFPGLTGRPVVAEVAPRESETAFAEAWADTPDLADAFPLVAGERRPLRIALVHCGLKQGIDDALRRRGARVRIHAPDVTADVLLAGNPDAVLLSNGPGDPQDVRPLIQTVRTVLGQVPLYGICLGHQVLALAAGGKTYKMKFGHHGINHPVRDEATGRVLVTSQNHGFAVDVDSLNAAGGGDRNARATVTHVSLNDQTVEGFALPELRAASVQFHPESCAGPHDARYLFDGFLERVAREGGAS